MSRKAKFLTKDFPAGKVLFKQGDEGDFIYIIINGTVEISRERNGKKEHVAHVSSGDILGEMAILTDETRCASATALEPTRVIMVNDRTLRIALLNNDLPIIKHLTKQLIFRFKEAEQQANDYRRKFEKLEKEVAALKQQLRSYEPPENN